MDRTSLFPGVAPKLEFSTYTAIREVTLNGDEADREVEIELASARRSKKRSKTGSPERLSDLDKMVNENLRRSKESIVIDDRPPFVVRHLDATLTARPPGLEPLGYALEARKREDIFRKAPKSARSARRSKSAKNDGPVDFLDGYHDDYKYRTNVDGLGNWYPYQPEHSSRFLEDKVSGRQYCTVCNLYKRYTGQNYSCHTFRDHVPTLSDLSERERESCRLRKSVNRKLRLRERENERRLKVYDSDSEEDHCALRRSCSLCRVLSASDLHKNYHKQISDKVHNALWRDRAYEERLANLVSKYDDERRDDGSLEKLERDLCRYCHC